MKAFNQNQIGQRDRSLPTCAYCRDHNHKSTECPHAEGDWVMFQRLEIPSKDPNNWTNNPIDRSEQMGLGVDSWYTQATVAKWKKDPSEWGKWYSDCQKTVAKIKQRREREELGLAQGKKRTSIRKCGFCGSTDHTRRNCSLMEIFKTQAIRANQEWRRQFHERFVAELGISEGALIKVKRRHYWNQQGDSPEQVAIVTAINWDELNICADVKYNGGTRRYGGDLNYDLRQQVSLQVTVGGQKVKLYLGNNSINNLNLNSMLGQPHNDTYEFLSVLSPSERPLDAEWIDQGHEDAVNFITKKRNYQKLKELGYVGLVEKWHKEWATNNAQ